MTSSTSSVQNCEMAEEAGHTESQRDIDGEGMAEVSQEEAAIYIDIKEVKEVKHKESKSDIDSEKVAEVSQKNAKS